MSFENWASANPQYVSRGVNGDIIPEHLVNSEHIHFDANNIGQLKQIPLQKYRVKIKDLIEVFDEDLIEQGQMKVDYIHGLVHCNPLDASKSYLVEEYYGIGMSYTPMERVLAYENASGVPISINDVAEDIGKLVPAIKSDYKTNITDDYVLKKADYTTNIKGDYATKKPILDKAILDYTNATVNKTTTLDWIYTATQNNTTTVVISEPTFSPINDMINIFYESNPDTGFVRMAKTEYTISSATLTLGFEMSIGDRLAVEIIKNTQQTIVSGGIDGSAIASNTILEGKLSPELLTKINGKNFYKIYSFTATTSTNTFTISSTYYNPTSDTFEIYKDNLMLFEGDEYSKNGLIVTLNFNLDIGEKVYYKIFKQVSPNPLATFDGGLIQDGSITKSKLSSDVIAKLDNVGNTNANIINLSQYPKLSVETDDTNRLQRAINSFVGNFAGTIIISEKIYVSNKITCNKTGLVLQGVGNKISKIISSYSGTALEIKPLYDGNPYTNSGYCKFFMNDISIQATGDAITTGIGLSLQWVYSSSFINLYTSGFAKHVSLKGCHLNTFYNLYQENADASDSGIEIHNRGIGLSADGTLDVAGETTSNDNSIIGGWVHNCSWDLTNMTNTKVENINIEPASNSIIVGDGCTFKECRFERLDYYVANGNHYALFPWFIIGNNCTFINNKYYQSGASQNPTNPVFKINGNFNNIEIPHDMPYNGGTITFGSNSANNTINYKSLFDDYQTTLNNSVYKQELTSIVYNSNKNNIIYEDARNCSKVEVFNETVNGIGTFTNYCSTNTAFTTDNWDKQGCTVSPVDISLPLGRTSGDTSFTKVALTTSTSNRRLILSTPNCQSIPIAGVYTLSAMVYVPDSTSTNLNVGAYLLAKTEVNARGKWIYVRSRKWFDVGDKIQPTFELNGVIGDIFYIGEVSVCVGDNSIFIKNYGVTPITASSINKVSNVVTKTSTSGSGLITAYGKLELTCFDNTDSSKFNYSVGYYRFGSIPIFTQMASNGITLGNTNNMGTVEIVGATNYTVQCKITQD